MAQITPSTVPAGSLSYGEWQLICRAVQDVQHCVQARVKPLLPGVAEELENSLDQIESLLQPSTEPLA